MAECFNRDLADVQCRVIIFGGSADNGYARLLQPYARDGSKNNKIVLLEGAPFAKELAELKDKFPVTRFAEVFRSTKLLTRRVSFSTTPPRSSTPSTPSYAATVMSHVGSDATDIKKVNESSMASPMRRGYRVLRNSKGQRIDCIITPSQSIVRIMRDTRHCNAYHILGECPYEECTFLHGIRLDHKGIDARRYLARYRPCPAKFKCQDEKCLLGHQCPEKACGKAGKGCRFPKEMHNVDRS